MRFTFSGIIGSFAAAVVLAAGNGTTLLAAPAPSYAPAKADAFTASNDPDRFAWQLFCAISAPAENEHPRDIVWETWPEQNEIYADPDVAPQWPDADFPGKTLRPSAQHHARRLAMAGESELPPLPKPRDGVANEEVRDNKEAFDYIVDNKLWYKEGIVEKVTNDTIEFPYGAIAIKGKWTVISDDQKPRFHWHEYEDPSSRKR